MLLLLGAFVAGLLTVLAPCVLPLLPIIIGGSVSGDSKDKKRPLVIAVSLAVSLIAFTLLLKVSTVFVNLKPEYINYFSGGIIIGLGLLTLFPTVYARIIGRVGIEHGAQKLLSKGYKNKSSLIGPIITGAALGPVFSSCSPFYGYILATILPGNFAQAMTYIVAYVLGLSLVLLLVGYYGQRFIGRIKFATNPRGWFQRSLAIIFILVGMLVFTGSAVKVQTYVSEHTPFKFDALSAKLIPSNGTDIDTSKVLNVEPYEAPEFVGLENWINSKPLELAGLEGKVVLLDFWTYSCINCIRATPYIQGWHETYKDSGLVVVGAHAPEFAFERVTANVQKAVKKAGITYPVALDNDFATWGAYKNQYWPASYLIDAEGQVRRVHYGEGEYRETEEAIRALLAENGASLPDKMFTTGKETVPVGEMQSPETYLGLKRSSNFAGTPALGAAGVGATSTFAPSANLKVNGWTLGGAWEVRDDKIIARGLGETPSSLKFRISAKEAYIVGASAQPQKIQVLLDGKPISQTKSAGQDVRDSMVEIGEAKLYRLVSHKAFDEDSTLELIVPDGVELNVFTFGS